MITASCLVTDPPLTHFCLCRKHDVDRKRFGGVSDIDTLRKQASKRCDRWWAGGGRGLCWADRYGWVTRYQKVSSWTRRRDSEEPYRGGDSGRNVNMDRFRHTQTHIHMHTHTTAFSNGVILMHIVVIRSVGGPSAHGSDTCLISLVSVQVASTAALLLWDISFHSPAPTHSHDMS